MKKRATILKKRIMGAVCLSVVIATLLPMCIGCADTQENAPTDSNTTNIGASDTSDKSAQSDTSDASKDTTGSDTTTSDTVDSDTTATDTSAPDTTGADTTQSNTTEDTEVSTKVPDTTAKDDENDTPSEVKPMLDGKKILIIGNSYVYQGNCVITKSTSVTTQVARNNDTGYFYQLCKANGCNVSVTNWTFGGHSLGNLFDGECSYSSCPIKGKCHEDYITDRYYDYVVVSPGGGTADKTIAEDFEYIINFFKVANPNVKIVCLGNLGAHGYSSSGKDLPGVYNYYKTLEDKGVIIADWGGIVWRIMKGIYTVPGAAQEYTQNTFIVKDGYHPNALAGYITALTAYCAITGEAAVGQPYSFYNNTDLSASFNMTMYLSNNYIGGNTNFTKVFASASDIKGIQQLVDKYLREKPFHSTLDKTDVATDTVMLDENPNSSIISVMFSEDIQTANGWRKTSSKWLENHNTAYKYFSGLRGDADAICSLEGTTTANGLSAVQKADIADIRYGISVIGLSHMELTAYDITSTSGNNNIRTSSLMNLLNGHFGSSYSGLLYFDSNKYNINGQTDQSGEYTALITLNFGEKKTFDAIGYVSGNLKNIVQAQDVYVSDDGTNWTKVEAASYDTTEITLYNIEDRTGAQDPWNNNTPSYEVLFDMNGVSGKYIRIGIKRGANDSFDGMEAREILIFGE